MARNVAPTSNPLSDAAQKLVREHTADIVPAMLRDRIVGMKDELFDEFLKRLVNEELYNEIADRVQGRVKYFGGSAHVGRINASSVDFEPPSIGTVQDLNGSGGSAIVGFAQSGTGAIAQTVEGKIQREVVSVFDRMTAAEIADVVAGTALVDVMPKWKTAIETNGENKTIKIPAGTHLFDADVLADIIKVPSGCEIIFEKGAKISFDSNAMPLFAFINVTHSALKGARFEFTGEARTTDAFTKAALATALGYTEAAGTFGGNYELTSLILGVGAEYCEFSDIRLKSTTNDNDHVTGYLINLKEDGTALTHVKGNVIKDIECTQCINPILLTGQQDCEISHIRSDRRGGNTYVAPGHVIYTSGVAARPNTNLHVSAVRDGANFIGWPTNVGRPLATLAPKNLTKSSFEDVVSLCPEGLIQSLQDVSKSSFCDFFWQNDDTEATTGTSPLDIVDGGNTPSNFDLRFDNFTMIARNNFRGIANTGTAAKQLRQTWTNIYIETDFNFYAGQGASLGAIDWRGADCTFRGIVMRPSATISGSVNTGVQWRAEADNNYLEGELIGQHVKPAVARIPVASGATGNIARFGPVNALLAEDYAWFDAFTSVALRGCEQVSPIPALRAWNFVALDTDRELVTTLPSRGCYLLFADVVESGRDHGQSGVFVVTFTGQTATINDVQQLGTTITRGSNISALSVAVTTAGVTTISWTSAVNNAARVNLGYIKLGSFVT